MAFERHVEQTRTNPRRATHNFENHHRDDSNLGAKALYCVGIVSIIKAIETMTAKLVHSQGIDLMLLAMVIAFRFNPVCGVSQSVSEDRRTIWRYVDVTERNYERSDT